MRFSRWFLAALAVIAIVVIIFTAVSRNDPNAPKYIPLQSQPKGPFGSVNYNWGEDAPFVDGKFWFFTILSRANHHQYLFDMDKGIVLGELTNGGVALSSRDYSKVLCAGHDSFKTSVKQAVLSFLTKITKGKLHFATNTVETYWVVDLHSNKARTVGTLFQIPGTGSRWRPSPDYRFGFNVPNNNDDEYHAFYLCDLEQETFRRIKFEGNVRGWWDEKHILISDLSGDLVLYDVISGKTSLLLAFSQIAKRLEEESISVAPGSVSTLKHWNGTNYDFMIVPKDTQARYTARSFIFKMERPDAALSLMTTNFQFRWLGCFNADRTAYMYEGEEGGSGKGGNGAVYLQDLRTDKTTTLVPPDHKGQYSLASFYKDTVIYWRNRELWHVNVDGSKNERLFPPPEE